MDAASNNINLAFSFDQNYIKPFFVLLTSIFANNQHEEIHFHVVLTNSEPAEKAKIVDFIKANNSHISFYDIEIEYVKSFAPSSERYGLATFYRLLLPEMLPASVSRFIYLDIDIVVVGKLRELYETPMGNSPVAAVAEPVDYARPDLGLFAVGEYFNAGVLLINLLPWQEQRIAEKAIHFLKEFPDKAIYLDQDALNAVLAHNWVPLEDKFNFTWRSIPYVPKAALLEMVATKTIVHFNTAVKPWHRLSSSRLDYLYHQFFDLSPVSHTDRFHRFNFSRKIVTEFILRKISYTYLDNAAINKAWKGMKKAFGT